MGYLWGEGQGAVMNPFSFYNFLYSWNFQKLHFYKNVTG